MTRVEERMFRKMMAGRIVNVEMSEDEVLCLHAASIFWDGRRALTKIIRRRIEPVALKIIEKRPEYRR